MNIVEPILAQCRNKPAELALCAPGNKIGMMSYARLLQSVNNSCRRMISLGVVPRSRIAVFIEDPILHAIVLISLTRLGVVTISVGDRAFSWKFSVDAIITDRELSCCTDRIIVADADWLVGDDVPLEETRIYRSERNEMCRIFLTSKSGGEEIGVATTHRMMAARIDRQSIFLGPRAPFCGRTCLALPFTTEIGFQILFSTLWRGGSLFLISDAQTAIQTLPIYKVENLVSSPESLLNLLAELERRPGYQFRLEAAFCSWGNLPSETVARIRAAICSNFTIGYSTVEVPMVASMPAQLASGGAVGYVLPRVRVEIVDNDDCPLPHDVEGIIRIKSEDENSEYTEGTEQSMRTFRDGWYYPGGVGHLTRKTMLVMSTA